MLNKLFVLYTDLDDPLLDEKYWSAELPAMLLPLFSAKPIYKSGNIYCEAQEGYQTLKEMYDFLAKHKDKVFERPNDFMAYKDKIFKTLKPIVDDDVLSGEMLFQISLEYQEEGFTVEQLMKRYSEIEKINDQIKYAIREDDIEKFWEITIERKSEYQTTLLSEWFRDEKHKYGYTPLSLAVGKWITKNDEYEIYTENDKQGLKLNTGEKVTEAIYDEIFSFDETSHLAVCKRNGKCGYVDQKGREIIEPVYEEAFSIWEKDPSISEDSQVTSGLYRARAVKDGKYGLIDEENKAIIPFNWDDMSVIDSDNYFIPSHILVKKDDKFGIYDQNGNEKYPVIIEDYLLGQQSYENRNIDYPIYGFPQCFLIKVDGQWLYLNNKFEPYGQNLYIKDDGKSIENLYAIAEAVQSEQNICFYKVRNKEWCWGVISSNDDILVPIQYKNIELLKVGFGTDRGFTYQAKKGNLIDVYRVGEDLNVELIFSDQCKSIKYWSEKIIEVTFEKRRIYDVDKKMYVSDGEYEWIIYHDIDKKNGYIYAANGNEVHKYDSETFERMEVNTCELSNVIHGATAQLPNSFMTWLSELKNISSAKAKVDTFSEQEDLEFIEKNLSDVDFSNDLSIYYAAGKVYADYNVENLELYAIELREIDILHIAHFHHIQRCPHDNVKLEHMGLISIYMAYMLYAKPDEMAEQEGSVERDIQKINECLQYARKHVPVQNDGFYRDILRLSILAAFYYDDHYSCLEYAEKLISFTDVQISELEGSRPLMRMKVSELNALRRTFKNDEELCHYRLASVYIGAELEDYSLARKHIELAMKCSDRWNYEKKYVHAAAMSEVESIDVFWPVLEEFDRTAQELKYTDFRWLYIRYLMAYHEYHSKGNIKKAQDLIEEALAVDPNYAFLVELKELISEQI